LLLCAHRLPAAVPLPTKFRDGLLWLKVEVSGTAEPLNFLLDSGAGATVLDLAAARRLGVTLGSPQSFQGVQGRGVAYRIENFSARTAGVAIAPLLALDLSGPSRACHQRIDGLLGADFFRGRIVQIDFASGTVRLLERAEVREADCEVLPLASRNDVLCARVSVNGNDPDWLRLDTGCSTSLEWVVRGAKARKLSLTTIGLNSGSALEIRTEVQLGTKRIAAVKTGIHTEQMFAGEAGLIGNGLLSRFTVTIDPARRRCLLASR
jgi:predicted aspartyl protease